MLHQLGVRIRTLVRTACTHTNTEQDGIGTRLSGYNIVGFYGQFKDFSLFIFSAQTYSHKLIHASSGAFTALKCEMTRMTETNVEFSDGDTSINFNVSI